MNEDELFELTPEQEKAFNRFKNAYKKCKSLGIDFYNNYGAIGALDSSKNIEYNDVPGGIKDVDQNYNEFRANDLVSWADDAHYFHKTEN